MATKFRKKPVVVEAIRWTGRNADEVLRFMCPDIPEDAMAFSETVKTLEGEMHVSKGDWVIKGIKGEFYPCKPDIFEATYEPVIAAAAPDERQELRIKREAEFTKDAINSGIDRLRELTGEDFHGYRSEILGVLAAMWDHKQIDSARQSP